MSFRLGKQAARVDSRTIPLMACFDKKTLPRIPPEYNFDKKHKGIPLRMYLNDKLGDCVIAGEANQITRFEHIEQDVLLNIKDAEVKARYFRLSGGYDEGLVMLNAMNDWRKNGFKACGNVYTIDAYGALPTNSQKAIKTAIYLLNGVQIGLWLPESSESQDGKLWKVVSGRSAERGSRGGHCVYLVGYDSEGPIALTWGFAQKMTWQFFSTYCVAPDTKVLRGDLTWVDASSLSVGDELCAFDEHAYTQGVHRKWKRSVVEQATIVIRPCVELEFEDGTKVVCTKDHKWLCSSGHNLRWNITDDLRWRGKVKSSVVKPLDVWTTNTSRAGGYLAAAFDGEGCFVTRQLSEHGVYLGSGTSVNFCQKNNAMYAEVLRCLTDLKITFNVHSKRLHDDMMQVSLSRRRSMLKFLGEIRPQRLLKKFDPDRIGSMTECYGHSVALVNKRDVGDREVIAMKTSTGTFLANGLASHNCDEAYGVVDSLDRWRNKPGIDVALLKEYLRAAQKTK